MSDRAVTLEQVHRLLQALGDDCLARRHQACGDHPRYRDDCEACQFGTDAVNTYRAALREILGVGRV
jgi:hypothetical protein